MRRLIFLLMVMLALGLLLFFFWSGNHQQDPRLSSQQPQILACPNPLQDCGDAQTQIRFSAIPRPLHPFKLQIRHAKARSVTVEMTMQGMQMGLNRYRLLPQGDVWVAEMILPACVQGRSDWLMTISIDDDKGKSQQTLSFQANTK